MQFSFKLYFSFHGFSRGMGTGRKILFLFENCFLFGTCWGTCVVEHCISKENDVFCDFWMRENESEELIHIAKHKHKQTEEN